VAGVSGTFTDRGELEPSAAAIIMIIGRKGSGKSVLANSFGRAWPYDMVVIDVAGDDGPDPRPRDKPGTHDVHVLTGPVDELPAKWPEHLRRDKRPMILRYIPDAGSPTEAEDMDHMVGLAYNHSSADRPAMLLIHEIGRVAPAGRTQPHMRRVLNHSRHRALTVVAAGPRTITVDPLMISQADLVYVFDLNQPADRQRVAENIGWDPKEFSDFVNELGRYEHLRYDAREPKPEPGETDWRLVHLDPLPEDEVRRALAWAHPGRAS
jgi:hypothetical protein